MCSPGFAGRCTTVEVAQCHPTFNPHTLRPGDFSLNSRKIALFQIGATGRFTCFLVHLSDPASKSATRAVTARHRGKRMMGADQRKPDKRKLLDRNSKKLTVGYSYFVALPPRNSLLCGLSKHFGWQNSGNEKTWVPPSHPADYFSTFEMNTESKEPVRKKQGKGN